MASRYRILLTALAAGLALASGSARADRLDNELHKRMEGVVERLKAKYKNVGVLPFRVQEGSRKESYDTPLSGRLAERLEMLLIACNAKFEVDALGVIRGAGDAAFAKKVGSWYASPEGRKKLFTLTYPLAWGDKQVEPDAFVTGKLTLSQDRKKTTLTLECFEKADPSKMIDLGAIDMGTDRFVLRDLGYSFALSRGAREKLTAKRGSLKDEEDIILEEVGNTDPPGDKSTKAIVREGEARAEPENIGGVAIEILADDKSVDVRPAGTAGDAIRWQLECPPAGAKVTIRLRNTTDKQLAVVLRFNGVSTINEQKDDPEHAAKWVIRPGRSILLQGFYLTDTESPTKPRGLKPPKKDEDGKEEEKKEEEKKEEEKKEEGDAEGGKKEPKVKPFKVLPGAAAKEADLGAKAGHIDIDVFEEGSAKDDEVLISPKGLPPSKEKQARSSYLGLRSAVLKSSKLSTVEVAKLDDRGLTTKREVIVPDKEAFTSDKKVKMTNFANARLAARLTIKVIAPDGVPIGD